MAKVTIKVLDAVVDGKHSGEVFDIDERSAEQLARLNYVEIVKKSEPKKTETKSKEEKKPTKKKTK